MRLKKFFKSRTVRVITAAVFILCTLFTAVLPSFAAPSNFNLPTDKIYKNFYLNIQPSPDFPGVLMNPENQQKVFNTLCYQWYFLSFNSLRPVAIVTFDYFVVLICTDIAPTYVSFDYDTGIASVVSLDSTDFDFYQFAFSSQGFILNNAFFSTPSFPIQSVFMYLPGATQFAQPSPARNFRYNSDFSYDANYVPSANYVTAFNKGVDLWSGTYSNHSITNEAAWLEGFGIGFEDGFRVGENSTEGYQRGFDEGKAQGLLEGYDEGYDEGYYIGFDDAQKRVSYILEIPEIIDSVTGSVTTFFMNAFDFNLFGINIAGLFVFLIATVVLIFVIRFVWGLIK